MNTFLPLKRNRNIVLVLLMLMGSLISIKLNAQPPDCVSGNVAYATFNDSIGSTYSSVLDSLEIRPVNLTTGVVGNLMGNKRYFIRKYVASTTYYYGSSALAVDFSSSKFYIMTQMSIAGQKDIVAIDPVLGTSTVTGSTPAGLDGYHFVKMTSHATNGYIYAIGVHRDSTTAANLVNPLIRFPVCATAGCATAGIQVLGYLPSTGVMYKWKLFNGDIAFDNAGNLFFATAAFEYVNSNSRYTDSRLFRINAADLPTTAGTGTIPMTLVADYNGLDSTVINGIAYNSAGTMFFTTRRYNGPQNPSPVPTYTSQLYRSTGTGTATLMPAFVPPTAGTSVSDLATCYYPAAVLANYKMNLTGQYVSGSYNLNWEAVSNPEISHFVLQKSADGNYFENTTNTEVNSDGSLVQKYSKTDKGIANASSVYYRVMEVTHAGTRYYSNVIRLSGLKMSLAGNMKPNPFSNRIELTVSLRIPSEVSIAMRDQNGRLVYTGKRSGFAGDNKFIIDALGTVKPGVYVVEINAGDEVIREKVLKQ